MSHLLSGMLLGTKLGKKSYSNKVSKILPSNLIGWWKMADTGGTICTDSSPYANNGTYTNITLAQPGFDGGLCALIDNTADAISVVAATAADFNGAEGGFIGWYKVSSAAVWSDGVSGRFARFRVNASNQVNIYKAITANSVVFSYIAGGTDKSVTLNPISTTDWFSLGFSWSVSGDAVKAYLNGVQIGSTLTGLGTWDGTIALGELGAGSAAAHLGYIQHCLLYNVAPSAAQMLALGTQTPG